MSTDRPTRDRMSLEEVTDSNMWEIRKARGSKGFRTAITKLQSAPKVLWMPAGASGSQLEIS